MDVQLRCVPRPKDDLLAGWRHRCLTIFPGKSDSPTDVICDVGDVDRIVGRIPEECKN